MFDILNSAIGFMSPRMDVNDMGFQGFSGVVNAHAGLGWRRQLTAGLHLLRAFSADDRAGT